MDEFHLPVDAFVRSVGVNAGIPHNFFLGAGASVTSGVPSVGTCVWEWKREIFLTNNPGLEEQFSEISLPAVREKIQQWFDRRGEFPKSGDDREYSFYIEQCFPVAEHRRGWFQEKIHGARPHLGYKALCALAQDGVVGSVWTTNFDNLTTRAAAAFEVTPVEVGLDTPNRLVRAARSGELLIVSLHGDYRYDHLRNTEPELRSQDEQLRQALLDRIKDTPLVVVGYSGRDQSVMDALREAYSKPGAGALYWCAYGDEDVSPAVTDLLKTARQTGRSAFLVPTRGFDDLLARLALRCCRLDRADGLRSMALATIQQVLDTQPFVVTPVSAGSLIKSNAFEISCPIEARQFEISQWPDSGAWDWLREKTKAFPVVAVPLRGRILALGDLSDIKLAFDGLIKGAIERVPLGERDLRLEDGAVTSLLLSALVRGAAAARGLNTDGRRILWDNAIQDRQWVDGSQFCIHDSAVLYLRWIGGREHLVLKPSIVVRSTLGESVPEEIDRRIRLSVLGWQHNAKFNAAMKRWCSRLFPGQANSFYFPPSEEGSRFDVRPTPVFAALRAGQAHAAAIPDEIQRHVRHHGFELEEPRLIFANSHGGMVRDVHPIRGILKNRPYDYSLTKRELASSVRIGVICPEKDSRRIAAFLSRSGRPSEPLRTERDYLLPFPGFQQAFGLPLELPQPGAPGWVTYREPEASMDPSAGSLELARQIVGCVDAIQASHWPCVALIYVPDRLDLWKRFSTDDDRFDLHDFVKAHCAPRGLTSQFLNEHTLTEQQQCRVWWWLSLALYVKSMRTPWVLDALDGDTAFVGLGFSIDRTAKRGRHVVLGCSHIYNARGEGLQYRLARIEDPQIRRGNPFMSRDDARRTGETIRQLFFESRMRLPRRVVVHKQTHFLRDEREGLLEGLGGVDEVDMLEIQIDSALRYVASMPRPGGKFSEDNYPVRRGSVVKLDANSALLWVHGVAADLNPSFKYYQGKRRIPAPLLVKRHAGKADLELICSEILGLSKMDWNSFDLYTKMPSTVESSGRIAQIGALLDRFGATGYDYRLFI